MLIRIRLMSLRLSLLILVGVLGYAVSLSIRASDLPESDQQVIGLTQEFDTLSTADMLFVQTVKEHRSVEEVAHALDVLADDYNWFYAGLSQFLSWLKADPNAVASLSESNREQIASLLKRRLQETPQFDTLMIPYQTDPRVRAAQAG